jgi:hypothetical protein
MAETIGRLLADIIRQCRLARWEEAHETAEELEIASRESVCYIRLLCAGQGVHVTVDATSTFTIILSIELGTDVTKEQVWLRQEESSSRFVYIAKKTAYYSLAVLNDSQNVTRATVRIKSGLRPASVRTYFEGAVRRVIGFAARTEAFHRAVMTAEPKSKMRSNS